MSARAFLARFAQLRRDVVRPVFDEVLPILRGRGHLCEIHEEEFAARPGGVSTEASIRLRLAPAGLARPARADEHRELSFSTRSVSRTVTILNGAAPHGSEDIGRIDAERVEDEVLKLLAATVRRP
jgi:hypothetical protein